MYICIYIYYIYIYIIIFGINALFIISYLSYRVKYWIVGCFHRYTERIVIFHCTSISVMKCIKITISKFNNEVGIQMKLEIYCHSNLSIVTGTEDLIKSLL